MIEHTTKKNDVSRSSHQRLSYWSFSKSCNSYGYG